MKRGLCLLSLVLILAAAPVHAAELTGQYIEARTCDVWTGPCFANGELNLTGKHAVLGWKVDKGSYNNVSLDGLSIVAVISASDTLGTKQTAPSKALLIVDSRASKAQRDALISLARKQAGDLMSEVVSIESAKVDLEVIKCTEGGCGKLQAGKAKLETRCLDTKHDKGCGNDWAYYPPLAQGVTALPAVAIEHSFQGKQFNETWSDNERRGAYVGSFVIR